MPINEWFYSGIRIALPLLFTALGGLLCEKSGIANIALEAFLLFTSFTAAAVMAVTHNIFISIGAGIGAGILIGAIYSFFTVETKSDQIIVGTGLNILALGTIPVLCKAFFGSSGQTPSLELSDRISQVSVFIFAGLAVFLYLIFIFQKTPFGIHIIASGDYPPALRSQGVSVDRTRWKAILLGSIFVAIGGIYLSIGAGSGFTRNMSAGRGYIALTALIFGRWKPIPTFFACLFFGLLDALQIFLQNAGEGIEIPTQLVQSLPYVFTLLALIIFSSKNATPKAINLPHL